MTPRQKANAIIELALDKGASDEERRSAAMRACKFIRKHNLLAQPRNPIEEILESNDETVKAAKTVFKAVTDPALVDSLKKIGGQIGRLRRR